MKEKIKKVLGANLKKIRDARNLTQEELAELINKNAQTVSRIETGKTFPTTATIELICEKLDITYAALFHTNPDSKKEHKIAFVNDLLNEASDEQLDFVHSSIEFIRNKNI